MSIPSPSPDLVEALKNGKAIAIVGSGLTTQVGGPSWDDLLYGILAEACKIRPDETEKIKAAFQEIKDNHLLGAAALLKSVLGSGFPNAVVRQIDWKRALLPRKEIKEMDDICDALFETCGPCEKRNLIPSINHRMIMQLPFRAIITTNYDRLLEKASTAEKINSVFTRSYPYLPKRVVEGKWFLLKVHGCVDTPEDIILSRDDYRKALFGEPLHDMLDSLFKTNEKFWIGYGHNDPTLDFLVDECREKLHLNGGFAAAKKQNYVLQNRFETAGIQPSWLDDYSQISGFLRKLAEATNSPLIFEIIVKCEWTGEQDALNLGKGIAEAFSKLGGDFELFMVENGSVRLFLETRAATLDEYHARLSGGDPEILKIIKQFNISSFDGSDVTNLVDNGIKDEIKSAKFTTEDVKEIKHSFPVPRQIPPPPRDFKGREEEIAYILSNFEKGATITGLRGMGGIGKTALALVLADRIKSQFPDGQIFVDMRGTSNNPDLPSLTPEDAMAQVIRAYNPVDRLPENSNELRGLYLSILAGKRALLLLDNAANGEQVEPLVPPAGCFVLITSRIKFALPGLAETDLDILPLDKACELLLEIAPRIGNRAEELAKICGYLPLALRNAAGALAEKKDLSVPEYAKRLNDKVALLKLVKGSFSLSYDLLTSGRKRQWRRLSVFPEDFDRNAATAVLKMAPDASADALSDLVRWSLVEFTATPDSEDGRYKLHDLARLFAESCLEHDEQADAQQKHAMYYSKVLSQAEKLYQKGGTNVLAGLKLFDREWANIKVGQAWIKNIIPISSKLNKSDLNSVLQLASSYANDGRHVLDLRLHPQDKIIWRETGLNAAKMMGDRSAESAHLCNLGSAYADLGETRKAIGYYERALKIIRKIGDRRGEEAALGNLGNAYARLGETRKAIEYYEQALAISREIGDRRGEGAHMGNLGLAYAGLGETRKAIEYHEQALAISHEIGDRRGEGYRLGNLGNAYAGLGETRKAIEYHEQALAISREIGDRRGEGADLGNLGLAYVGLGETRKAIEYYEQALAISREIGDRRGEGNRLGNQGNAYSNLGETRKAIEYHEQALAISREIGDRRGEGADLGNLGNAYSNLGETRKAIEYYEQALAISREIGDRRGEGAHMGNLGLAYAGLGETRKAIEYHEQALAISHEIGDRRGEGNRLGNLGNAYAGLGETRKAIEYHEQALAISREIGDRRGEGADLGNLGLAYVGLGETRKAIEYHEQALAISREIGDKQNEGEFLCNLGKAYLDLNETEKAIEYCTESLNIVRMIEYRRIEGDALCTLGKAYSDLGEIDKAIDHCDQALKIFKKMEYRNGEGEALFAKSLALDKLGQRTEAAALANEALQIFSQIESPLAEKVRQKLAEWAVGN